MYKILLVTTNKRSFAEVASGFLSHSNVDLSWADSGNMTLDMISKYPIDLVVSDDVLGDMSGLDLALKMLSVNPMVNCALASCLSHEDFHEASEGLGLLAQLSLKPDAEDAEYLLQRLNELRSLSINSNVNL